MQMIGRGMRGPQAKGTETVNIVDFHDNWNVFQKWLDPQWIIEEELDEEPESASVRKKLEYETYDWQACRALYRSMRVEAAALDCTVVVPSGWYTLVDEEGELVRMLVFEDQLSGLKAKSTGRTILRSVHRMHWNDIFPVLVIRRMRESLRS